MQQQQFRLHLEELRNEAAIASFDGIELNLENAVQFERVQELCDVLRRTRSSLRHASFRGCLLGDAGVRMVLEAIGRSSSLYSLDFTNNSLTDNGCADIASHLRDLPFLTQLTLAQNGIGDEGAMALKEQLMEEEGDEEGDDEDSDCLYRLDLEGNCIGHVGIAALHSVQVSMWSSLRVLFVRYQNGDTLPNTQDVINSIERCNESEWRQALAMKGPDVRNHENADGPTWHERMYMTHFCVLWKLKDNFIVERRPIRGMDGQSVAANTPLWQRLISAFPTFEIAPQTIPMSCWNQYASDVSHRYRHHMTSTGCCEYHWCEDAHFSHFKNLPALPFFLQKGVPIDNPIDNDLEFKQRTRQIEVQNEFPPHRHVPCPIFAVGASMAFQDDVEDGRLLSDLILTGSLDKRSRYQAALAATSILHLVNSIEDGAPQPRHNLFKSTKIWCVGGDVNRMQIIDALHAHGRMDRRQPAMEGETVHDNIGLAALLGELAYRNELVRRGDEGRRATYLDDVEEWLFRGVHMEEALLPELLQHARLVFGRHHRYDLRETLDFLRRQIAELV